MKTYYKLVACLLILGFSMLNFNTADAACNFTSAFGSATINTSGSVVTISTCSYRGEYSTINGAVSGQQLRFTISGGYYITVRTAAGALLAEGFTPLTYTNTFTGTLRAHWSTSGTNCTPVSGCLTTTVQCLSCSSGPCVNTSSYGGGAINPSGSITTLSTCSYRGEYSPTTGAVAGQTLQFTCTGGSYIVVRSGTYNGPVLAQGASPLTFVNTYTGTIYPHWMIAANNCTYTTGCQTTTVQCLSCVPSGCSNTSAFGSATIPTNNTVVTVSTCTYAGEYNTCNSAVAGSTLRFTSSVSTDYITVRSGTPGGAILGQGTTPLQFVNTFNGTVYAHYNTNSSCGTQSSCRTTTVQCVSCTTTAPANDLCTGATALTCGGSISGNTATGATPDANSCGGTATPGVWHTITPASTSNITLSLCGASWDTRLSVYSGTCASLVDVGCNDDFCGLQSQLTFTGSAGVTYRILVNGYSTASNSGPYTLTATCTAITPPPANDNCAGATSISCGSLVTGDNTYATDDAGFPACTATGNNFKGVWYSINLPTSGTITATTCSYASWDTYLRIFSGTCGSLTCVANNDDACGLQSSVTTSPVPAGTYYILLSGYSSTAFGAYSLSVNCSLCSSPPSGGTATGPASGCTGSQLVYNTVSSSGSLQWQRSITSATGPYTDIAGATSPTLVYVPTAAATKYFRVVASSAGCVATNSNVVSTVVVSSGGTLTTSATPSATACPGTTMNLIGNFSTGSASLTITVGDLSYYLDETTYQVKNSSNVVIYNSGTLNSYAINTATVTPSASDYPVTFILETQGTFNDNTPDYSVVCNANSTTLVSGTMSGGSVFTSSPLSCAGTSGTLTNPSWSGPNGFTSNSMNASLPVTATSAGIYTITGLSPTGCPVTSSITVNVNPAPNVIASSNAPVCEGFPLTLFGFNNGSGQTCTNWSWSGPGYSSLLQNPTIGTSSFAYNGTFTLTVTNNFGCTASTTTSVIINPNPVLNVTSTTAASCIGETDGCIDVNATNGTAPYLYDFQGNSTLDGVYCGLGAGTYTVSVIDDNSCESMTTATVIEDDNVDPQITCPSNVTAFSTPSFCAGTAAWIAPVGTDNCIGAVTVQTGGLISGSSFSVGTTPITYTVTDVFNNTETCSFNVIIVDSEAPSIICPAPITINNDPGFCAGTIASLGTPVTADNCAVGSVVNDHSSVTYPVGTTTVNWTVTDIHSNTAACTQQIIVVDNENPTITCPSPITINNDQGFCEGTIASLGIPVTADNCAVGSVVNDHSSVTYPVGTTSVDWTVTDIHSNTAVCTQQIIVNDNENPTITCPANITIYNDPNFCSGTIASLGTPLTADNCAVGSVVNNHPSATYPVGTTSVGWTVTDIHSNIAVCNQTIVVTDNQNPTITCPPIVIVNSDPGVCYATNINLGTPVYGDNCSGSFIGNNVTPLTQYPVGGTFVQWEVTDLSSNKSSCDQLVIVQDHENPVALCKNICVSLNSAGTATITGADINNGSHDNCGIASITASKTSFSYADAGANSVTLTVLDINGNSSTCTATVTVGEYFTLFGSDNNCSASPGGAANCFVNISNGSSVTGNVGSYRLVQTGGAVTINGKVVSGGKVSYGNSVTSGSVSSANLLGVPGNVFTTGSGAHILGDIDVSGNINVNQNAGSTVTGTVRHPAGTTYIGPVAGGGVLTAMPVLPALPGMPAIHSYSCGGVNISGSAILNPGSYGNLVMGNAAGVVVTFHGPGNYYFSNINLSQGGIHTFKYDFMGLPGNINIYVCSAIHLGQIATQWEGPNTPDACRVYFEIQGNGINVIGQGSQFYGRMWSPYSGINVGGGSCCTYITGSLWSAQKVDLNGAVTVTGCGSPCPPGPRISEEITATDASMNDMLQVYPNPTSGKTTVRFFTENSYDYTLKVFDNLGRMVISKASKAAAGNNMQEVDMSGWPKGLYMIEVANADHSQKVKVVVQ